jgi:hypothetical protein
MDNSGKEQMWLSVWLMILMLNTLIATVLNWKPVNIILVILNGVYVFIIAVRRLYKLLKMRKAKQ